MSMTSTLEAPASHTTEAGVLAPAGVFQDATPALRRSKSSTGANPDFGDVDEAADLTPDAVLDKEQVRAVVLSYDRNGPIPTAARKKMIQAFKKFYDEHPFFARIGMNWRIIEHPAIPTMATDGKHLFWNPMFVDKLSLDAVVFVLAHEASHVAWAHHLRMGERNPHGYNISSDLAINSLLRQYLPKEKNGKLEAGLRGAVFAGRGRFVAMPHDRSSEWYYHELFKDIVENEMTCSGGDQGDGAGQGQQQSQPQSGQQGQGSPGQQGSQQGQSQGQAQGQGQSQGQQAQPGSGGQGDQPQEKYSGPNSDLLNNPFDGVGDVWQHPEIAKAHERAQQRLDNGEDPRQVMADLQRELSKIAEGLEKEWTDQVAQACAASKGCGNEPGFIREMMAEFLALPSEIDWKALLRRFMAQSPTRLPTYKRPDRRVAAVTRTIGRQVFMPGSKPEDGGRVLLVVDTSGSMSVPEMNVALRELEAIVRVKEGIVIDMVQCDTRLINEATKTFTKADFPLVIPPDWMGRGGTDLSPVFDALRERRSLASENDSHKLARSGVGFNLSGAYDHCVVVSDMGWHAADVEDTGVPTIWLNTTGGADDLSDWNRPKFGVVLGPVRVDS